MAKLRIAHIINPVIVPESSDLFLAQPVTFSSMKRARDLANEELDVELWTATYPEDKPLVPDFFNQTESLARSVLDEADFAVPRKLPLLTDILTHLYDSSDADYFVYSNVDIAVQENFYLEVADMLENHKAIIINRRTISKDYEGPEQLKEMYRESGKKHPGFDCFIFPRSIVPDLFLGKIMVGANFIGRSLALNLLYYADSFRIYRNRHLTFHLGEDRVWKSRELSDFEVFNKREYHKILQHLKHQFGPATVAIRNFIHFDNPFVKPFNPKILQGI